MGFCAAGVLLGGVLTTTPDASPSKVPNEKESPEEMLTIVEALAGATRATVNIKPIMF